MVGARDSDKKGTFKGLFMWHNNKIGINDLG